MSEVSEVFGVGGRTALYTLWGRISGSSLEGRRIGSRHGAEGSRLFYHPGLLPMPRPLP